MRHPPWQDIRALSPEHTCNDNETRRSKSSTTSLGVTDAAAGDTRPFTVPAAGPCGGLPPLAKAQQERQQGQQSQQGQQQGQQLGQGSAAAAAPHRYQQHLVTPQPQPLASPITTGTRPSTALGTIIEESGLARGNGTGAAAAQAGPGAGVHPAAAAAEAGDRGAAGTWLVRRGSSSVASSLVDTPAAWGGAESGDAAVVALWSLRPSRAPSYRLEYASHYSSIDSHPAAAGMSSQLDAGVHAGSDLDASVAAVAAAAGMGMVGGASAGGGLGDSWQSLDSRSGSAGFGSSVLVSAAAAAAAPAGGEAAGRRRDRFGSGRSSASSFLNSSEVRRLREMADVYAQAEALTQQLLDEAHQLLRSPMDSFASRSEAGGLGEGAEGRGAAALPAAGAAEQSEAGAPLAGTSPGAGADAETTTAAGIVEESSSLHTDLCDEDRGQKPGVQHPVPPLSPGAGLDASPPQSSGVLSGGEGSSASLGGSLTSSSFV